MPHTKITLAILATLSAFAIGPIAAADAQSPGGIAATEGPARTQHEPCERGWDPLWDKPCKFTWFPWPSSTKP